ncbi:MAG: biotin/lipoyl-containing protein, partial [Rhodoferax sp.]
MSLIEVKVPDIGDFDEVAVIELLVKAGDTVTAEQSLITVESDKASMEIPSSAAGVVKELKVALGDKVKQGSLVLMLEVTDASAAVAAPVAAVAQNTQEFKQNQAVAPVSAAQSATTSVATSVGPIEVRVPDIGDF